MKPVDFSNLNLLIVGDIMLDDYIFGDVMRLSPEAPVPVVHVKESRHTAGGAANVIKNIKALGANCFVCGMIGKDDDGQILENLLKDKIGLSEPQIHLIKSETRPTVKKTRVIGAGQQICRIDWEDTSPITSSEEKNILEYFEAHKGKINAVIISDYGKGLVSQSLMQAIVLATKQSDIPISVDPYTEHYHFYSGATLITPNLAEAEKGLNFLIKNAASLERAGQHFLENLNLEMVLITQGKDGMSLFQQNKKPTHIPTVAKQVFDVTGAGDTVISVFTLALCAGLAPKESAILANRAGGIVVAKLGAATVSPAELFSQ